MALMISMDINHPDILDFIKIKRDLTQVTGANISIKLNRKFMEAVEENEDYLLHFPCETDTLISVETWDSLEYNVLTKLNYQDLQCVKKIKAKEYWDEIIKSAHSVAEPGLMFWDNMTEYSPDGVYPEYKQVTTNPCSEIAMQPYDACRLICLNLYSFVKNPYTENAYFDFEEFYKINYEAMRLSDNLIDLELEHIERIINKIKSDPQSSDIKKTELDLWYKIYNTAKASRRTGLGFTALGDMLAALNLGYDSVAGRVIVDSIMQEKMKSELDCTTDLAILRGIFEGWNKELEFTHYTTSNEFTLVGYNKFYRFLLKTFPEQTHRMYKHGRRNVSWSTVNGGFAE